MGASNTSLEHLNEQGASTATAEASEAARRELVEELARQTEAEARACRKMARRLRMVLQAGRARRNSAWTCSRAPEGTLE
jgi:hypothetical protein